MSEAFRRRHSRRAGSWRTCAGCGRPLPRKEALRLVRGEDGCCLLDMGRKRAGRGLNLCWNASCWQKAEQRGAAARRLGSGARLQAQLIQHELEGWLEQEFRRLWLVCWQGSWLILERKEVENAAAAGRAALLLRPEEEEPGAGGPACVFVPYRRVPRSWLEGGQGEQAVAAVKHRGLAKKLLQLLDRLRRHRGAKGEVSQESGSLARGNGLAVDTTASGVDYASVRGRQKV